jgi:hypothetical protein
MRPLRSLLLSTALLLAAAVPASAGWAPLGSPGQPLVSLQIAPLHPEILYARVFLAEGPEEDYLWRSEDGGATWRDVQIGLERQLSALAIDPNDPRVIWVWTADGELWRSADAGDTWSHRYTRPDSGFFQVFQLLVDPRSPETLYRVDYDGIATGTRVAVSRDGGATFSEGAFVPHFTGLDSIYPLPGRDELVSFDDRGLEVSTDGGRTWTLRSKYRGAGFQGGRVAPSSPDVLYGLSPATVRCLTRSDDAGAHWQTLASPPHGANDQFDCYDVAIDPLDSRHVWVAANAARGGRLVDLLFESHDGGATWSQTLALPGSGVVAAGGATLYTGGGGFRKGGLFVSRNGGQTWKETDRGLLAGDLRAALVAQRPPGGGVGRRLLTIDTPAGGGPEGGYLSDGGRDWVRLSIQPARLADAGGSNVVTLDENGLQRSRDGGAHWRTVPSAPPGTFDLLSNVTQPRFLALQAFEDNGAYGNVVLWTSDDAGATWRRTTDGLPIACTHVASVDWCPGFFAYAVDPFDPGRRWVASVDAFPPTPRLFLSEDAGATWRLATTDIPGALALAADPGARGRLLAGTGAGLFASGDGGLHWSPLGDLPDGAAVRQLAWDPLSASWYASTVAHGIYRSLDGGAHWTLLAGAPDHDAPTIAVDPRRPTALLAAFTGQGLWRWTP